MALPERRLRLRRRVLEGSFACIPSALHILHGVKKRLTFAFKNSYVEKREKTMDAGIG